MHRKITNPYRETALSVLAALSRQGNGSDEELGRSAAVHEQRPPQTKSNSEPRAEGGSSEYHSELQTRNTPMSLLLHLQNLPLLASSLDIRKFFLGLDILPGGVQILGGVHGDAFIHFNGEDQLLKALSLDRQPLLGQPVKLYLANKHDVQKVLTKSLQEPQSSSSSSKNTLPSQSHTDLPPVMPAAVFSSKRPGLAGSPSTDLNREYNVRYLESDNTSEFKRRRISESTNRLLISSSDEKVSVRMHNITESTYGEEQILHSHDKTDHTDRNLGNITSNPITGGARIDGRADENESAVEWCMSQHRDNRDVIHSNRAVDRELYSRNNRVDPIHSTSPMDFDTGCERQDSRRDRAPLLSPEPGYVQASNLPITTTAADLREFFSGYVIAKGGITMKASIVDPDTLVAYVKFVTMKDAIRADCICDGFKLYGKIISVSLISKVELECALSGASKPHLVHPSQPASNLYQYPPPYKQPPALMMMRCSPPRDNSPVVPINHPATSPAHPWDSFNPTIKVSNAQPNLYQPQPKLSQPQKQYPRTTQPAQLKPKHRVHRMFNPEAIMNMVYIKIAVPESLKKRNGATQLWSMVGGSSKCAGVIVTHMRRKSGGIEEAILAFTTIVARDKILSCPALEKVKGQKRILCNGPEMLSRLKDIALWNKDIYVAPNITKSGLDQKISLIEISLLLQANIKSQIKPSKKDLPTNVVHPEKIPGKDPKSCAPQSTKSMKVDVRPENVPEKGLKNAAVQPTKSMKVDIQPLTVIEVKKEIVKYLHLVKLREDITACEIWGWFDDVNGPSSGVKLVRKKGGPVLYAFVTINDFAILEGSYLEDRLRMDSYKFIGEKAMLDELSMLDSRHEVMQSTDSEIDKVVNIHEYCTLMAKEAEPSAATEKAKSCSISEG